MLICMRAESVNRVLDAFLRCRQSARSTRVPATSSRSPSVLFTLALTFLGACHSVNTMLTATLALAGKFISKEYGA